MQENVEKAVGPTNHTPPLALGAACWAVFCAVAVGLRGVRWDETYEHAQILAGLVAYPATNPMAIYVHNVFSAQTYFSAALLWMTNNAAVLCALRNTLFLIATVLPVYLLAACLSGRSRWGHVAALLALQGILVEFDGSYPLQVWPELYANGHIGTGLALLSVFAIAAGYLRLGACLSGIMPCIHIGQWPPVLALTAVAILVAACSGERRHALAAGVLFLAGLGVCGAFWLVQREFAIPLPDADPAEIDRVWRAYTFHHDPHRMFPPANGQLILCIAVLLAALSTIAVRTAARDGARAGGVPPESRAAGLLFVYALVICAVVWGVMLAQTLLGDATPRLLVIWMPYRLINHVPPLALAISVGILARSPRPALAALNLLALAFCAIRPLLVPVLGQALHLRYVATGDAVAFGLFGAALSTGMLALPHGVRPRVRIALVLAVVAGVAAVHQFGAVCLAAGATVALLIALKPMTRIADALTAPAIAYAICALAAISLLAHEARFRQHLPSDPASTAVRERFAGTPDIAPLLTEPYPFMLQARTGLPILTDAATPSLISYLPRLGPGIQRLYKDIYGIDLLDQDANAPDWQTIWKRRTPEEWRVLAERYGLANILAPRHLELTLPRPYPKDCPSLYRAR